MNNEPTIMLDRLVASIRRGDATLAEAGAYDLVRAWEVAEQRITELEAEVERLKLLHDASLRAANSLLPGVHSVGSMVVVVGRQLRELRSKVERLHRIVNEFWGMFYGQGYDISGWHLNGDLEPIDNFFKSNDWAAEVVKET